MWVKIILSGFLLLQLPVCDALSWADVPQQTLGNMAAIDIALWCVSMLAVLGVFLLGYFWGVRKFVGVPTGGAEKMRVVGGLSMGLWRKVVLLQVGRQQLVLGVTPGRIQTLHVLEDDLGLLNVEMEPRGDKGAKTENLAATETERSARVAVAVEQKPANAEPSRLTEQRSYPKHLAYVQSLADENPKLVAQTLKAWIRDE